MHIYCEQSKVNTNYPSEVTPAESKKVTPQNSVHGDGYAQEEEQNLQVKNQETEHKHVQKRSENELINNINALCEQYGICKNNEEKLVLLEGVAGCSRKMLLYCEQKEINKIVNCLTKALEKISKANKNFDLEEVKKLANDYNIAIHTGWTIEEFEKAQKNRKKESLLERLDRVYPKYKGQPEEQLKAYFHDYYEQNIKDKLAKAKTEEEKMQIRKDAMRVQLKDMGRLLANSSDEEKEIFKAAAKHMLAGNKAKFFIAILKSLKSDEDRANFADECDANYVQELAETPDEFGEYSSQEEIEEITSSIAQNQTETGRMEFHEGANKNATEFFEAHKKELEVIEEKIKNGEELTSEEQKLKRIADMHTAIAAGEMVGTENSVVLEDEQIDKIMTTLNEDAYELPNYRDVLKQVQEYIEKHPEVLTMTTEQFMEKLDEVTNGNFSVVVDDAKNGTTSSLNPPKASSDTTTATTETTETQAETPASVSVQSPVQETEVQFAGLGFAQKQDVPSVNHKPVIIEHTQVDDIDDVVTAVRNGENKVVKEYLSKEGNKGIIEVLENSQLGIWYKNIALNMFKRKDSDDQAEMMNNQSNNVLADLINVAKKESVLRLEGDKFLNDWAKKKINETQEKIRKLNPEYTFEQA